MRLVGSAHANLFNSVSAGIHALSGPLHGGANQAVLEMLGKLHESGEDPKKFMERVKNKEDGVRLMGFGHRVYKNYDPRAAIIKKAADEILEKLGQNDPLLDIAKGLEEIALADDYFVERRLYPNVDFYTGLIYKAMGFPSRRCSRCSSPSAACPGWIAQWREMMSDPETKIGRPRQIYTGAARAPLPEPSSADWAAPRGTARRQRAGGAVTRRSGGAETRSAGPRPRGGGCLCAPARSQCPAPQPRLIVTVVPAAPADHPSSPLPRSHARSPIDTRVAPYCSARATAHWATAHACVCTGGHGQVALAGVADVTPICSARSLATAAGSRSSSRVEPARESGGGVAGQGRGEDAALPLVVAVGLGVPALLDPLGDLRDVGRLVALELHQRVVEGVVACTGSRICSAVPQPWLGRCWKRPRESRSP